MFVIYVSLNYQKVPIEVREKFALSKTQLAQADRQLNQEKSVLENVILSTCNRTDVYAVVDQVHTGRYYIKRFLANWFHVSLDQLNQWVQIGVKEAAASHLFRVTVGLESLMVGEPQILGQVKAAYFLAADHGTTGAILDHLFKQAITFAKRMHTAYRVSELSQTSGQAGLHQIKLTLGSLTNRRLAIVGMGQEGSHVLKNASTMGFEKILIYNRTNQKAEIIAEQYDDTVQALPWRSRFATIPTVDAVITATSATTPVFDGHLFSNQNGPKILIDLGVPRNIAQAGLPERINYWDIDHLTQTIEQNQLLKQRLLDRIAQHVPKAVEQFYIWQKQLHVVPVIRELRESSLKIEKGVYDSLLRKLPDLDAHERKVISKHLKSIINQMIKGPIKTIKEQSVQPNADADLQAFCRIFGLTSEAHLIGGDPQTTTEQEKISNEN